MSQKVSLRSSAVPGQTRNNASRNLSSSQHVAIRPRVTRRLPRVADVANRQLSVRAVIKDPTQTSLGPIERDAELPMFGKGKEDVGKPRIVVLGSGWAAMSLMKSLRKETAGKYEITIVSPRNYFLYTPLLPAVASGTCEERSIVEPVRNFVVGKGDYFEAVCQKVDPENKRIIACFPKDAGFPAACFQVPYDILVVAVGCTSNTFGCPGVEENCLFFKGIGDAKRLRRQISECFERAALPYTPDEEKKKLLSFVVVGGGPTGVEVAAEVHDMVTEDLSRLYPELMPFVKIRVVELMDHVLGTYDRAIQEFTKKQFSRSGIDLVTNSRVAGVRPDAVEVFNVKTETTEDIPYGACVWATGIKMNPLVKEIQEIMPEGSQTHFRSLVTDGYMRVKGSNGTIYCMGDAGTIAEEQAQERAAELFKEGDANGDGKLQLNELRDILLRGSKEFPQLAEYATFLDGKAGSLRFGALVRTVLGSMSSIKAKNEQNAKVLGDIDMESELSEEEFKELLQKIDSGLRGLPATAQVANQQGAYLASLLASTTVKPGTDLDDLPKFKYNHKGSLAYVGQDQAVLDAPIFGAFVGAPIGVLWKSYETYGQFSFRNRVLVALDWLRSKMFGRDISRI